MWKSDSLSSPERPVTAICYSCLHVFFVIWSVKFLLRELSGQLMIKDFLKGLEPVRPLLGGSVCLLRHAFNSVLAFPSYLCRALRATQGHSAGPGQVHSHTHVYALLVSRNFMELSKFCSHLIPRLFLLSFSA